MTAGAAPCELPARFVDQRIGHLLGLLIDSQGEPPVPMTRELAMEFARNAYARGYMDQLDGVSPDEQGRAA